MLTLLQEVKNNLVLKNQKIGLAVSGGVDSMVLLNVFHRISKESGLKLYVMHYNHKWRKESFKDAELIRKYCKKNKIKFLYKESKGRIIKDEEIAREQRYSFFQTCAKKNSLKVICTAHHRDDQLETILFRLARGTGPNGLCPIKEVRELPDGIKIFRPFLHIWKKDLARYAVKNRISYIEDKTNLNVIYKRNLIRRKILPLLKKINPEAENNILVFSDLAYSQYMALNNYFSVVLNKVRTSLPLTLNRNKFLKLDYYTQTAFIYWLFTTHGIKGAVSKIHVIRNVIINQKKIDLSKKYIMNVTGNKIAFDVKSENENKEVCHSRGRGNPDS